MTWNGRLATHEKDRPSLVAARSVGVIQANFGGAVLRLLAPILLCACLCPADLSSLMQTDPGGNLDSHMFLAATHGYDVDGWGTVNIDGHLYAIWPNVRAICTKGHNLSIDCTEGIM